jgi:hypothetical protein
MWPIQPPFLQHVFLEDILKVIHFKSISTPHHGARGGVVVKALCYKTEGRGF